MNRGLIKQARGEVKADFVLKNCKVINVFTKTIDREDIAISNGIILGTGTYFGKEEIDCSDFFVSPGFIDGHCHIESSMVTPSEYAKLVLPNGTTSVIADCHEIANVCGKIGVKYMIESAKKTPLDVFMMIPSCVPATSFETSGAILGPKEVEELKHLDNVLGLGEMMNYPGVIEGDESVHDKLDIYEDLFIDGHAPSVFGKDLNAYILSGVRTDHECTSPLELIDKVKKGMYIHLREGSQTRNVLDLLPGVKEQYINRLLFCTDDLHPSDILKDGHINNNINIAIKNGLDPIDAIRMASINIATCYGLKHLGAIAPGYFADLVLFKDIKQIIPEKVYKKGKLVALNRKPLFESEQLYEQEVLDTVHFNLEDFEYKYHLKSGFVNTIQLVKNNVTTRKSVEVVNLIDGDVDLSKSPNLLKLFIVERHHFTGNVGKALLDGYGLKKGAIALSVAHDSHNVVVVGDNETDVLVALEKIKEITGGIVLVENGKVYDFLQLEVAGLMTNKPGEYVKDKLEHMEKKVREMGVSKEIDDPFLSLAFLSLPVIPDIKITDKGLFDVVNFKIIPLEAGEDL
ncbi:MAG: adenine deaminase [Bacteroidetes bacterium]|nr:MAG: adenine deaminase [Tenericutes bacterium 4572_104]RLD41995.1 MAG: adenine deaminase [Bacteroidota bacterium]